MFDEHVTFYKTTSLLFLLLFLDIIDLIFRRVPLTIASSQAASLTLPHQRDQEENWKGKS